MKTAPLFAALAFGLLGLAAAGPASAATARASDPTPIYAGPDDFTQIVGKLDAGDVVNLDFCEPDGKWCRVLHDGPTGWVLASFLIGSPAKIDATPGRSLTEVFTSHEGVQTNRHHGL